MRISVTIIWFCLLQCLLLLYTALPFQTQHRRTPLSSAPPSSRHRCPLSPKITHTVLVLSSLDEELPKFPSSGNAPNDDNDKKDSRTIENSNKRSGDDGLLIRLNEYGQSLKPKAVQVYVQAAQTTKMNRRIGLKAKSCLYWTLYIAYRGYRGFFVIMPAVFREVYRKMESAVDFRYLDDDEDVSNAGASGRGAGGPLDVNPTTGKVRWRTRITVSVLAGFVTLSYVVGGLARVVMKFVRTMLQTSSLSDSFSMAAEEVEGNESRLMRLSGQKSNNDGAVNGRDSSADVEF
jgi:hypothetical protein